MRLPGSLNPLLVYKVLTDAAGLRFIGVIIVVVRIFHMSKHDLDHTRRALGLQHQYPQSQIYTNFRQHRQLFYNVATNASSDLQPLC